jgi:hypothetical protein
MRRNQPSSPFIEDSKRRSDVGADVATPAAVLVAVKQYISGTEARLELRCLFEVNQPFGRALGLSAPSLIPMRKPLARSPRPPAPRPSCSIEAAAATIATRTTSTPVRRTGPPRRPGRSLAGTSRESRDARTIDISHRTAVKKQVWPAKGSRPMNAAASPLSRALIP